MKTQNDLNMRSYIYLAIFFTFFSMCSYAQHGLQVEHGAQNTTSGGGMAVIGQSTGVHLKFDNNGIQAGNNTSASTLYQNYWGGSINMLGAANSTGNLSVDGNAGINYINGTNRLGIGTASPLDKLHIAGNARISNDLIFSGYEYFSGGDDGVIKSNPALAGSDLWLVSNDAVVIELDNNDDEEGDFGIWSGANTALFQVIENGNSKFYGLTQVESANSTANALEGKFTYASGTNADRIGVYGQNTVDPNYGYGVRGEGGWYGVYGIASASGVGNRYGVYGRASAGTSANYSIYGSGGSGGSSNYAGYFTGNVNVTGIFTNPSDAMLKTDVERLEPIIEKVNQLVVKKYNHKSELIETMNLSDKAQIGFIAQEIQTVFPDLITQNTHAIEGSKDETIEYLGVNYIGLIPILTKSIQELSAENQDLKDRLTTLERIVANLKK